MASPTQFRHYIISQDADGGNIEIARSGEQVGVLAFDSVRLEFVHCHVLLEPLRDRRAFEERARRLGSEGHPLLARVLDAGEDEGSAFYITENVDGETLSAFLARLTELPLAFAADLTEQSLAALEALAARGNYVPLQPLDALRVVQTGPGDIRVQAADFRLAETAIEATLRSRQTRSAHEKQGRFLLGFFREQGQAGAAVNRADFGELLLNLLLSCGPDSRSSIPALRKELAALASASATAELPPALRPRPLLAPLLASFQEVARSVAQVVRVPSQKLDPGEPYAMRGTLMRSSQPVVVEQVPPARLAGIAPAEALRQARNLPKTAKFPNLVPLVFLEKAEALECAGEVAVEGPTLAGLLAAREALEPHEIALVFSGLDAALGQLEKAARAMRRVRLEDIFLFTGFRKEREPGAVTAPLDQPLMAWPGFSIVLRGHPSVSSMAGRGLDPGMLLPLEPVVPAGVEPLWNGGWMAALGLLLLGDPGPAEDKAKEACRRAARELLEEELVSARRGTPASRAGFIQHFSRLLERHPVAGVKPAVSPERELAGSTVAVPRPAPKVVPKPPPVAEAAPAIPSLAPRPELPPLAEEPALPMIGFAEALISAPGADPATRREGEMEAEIETYVESSWTSFREEQPAWVRITAAAVGAMLLGFVLAHLQGRGLWQHRPVRELPVDSKAAAASVEKEKPKAAKPQPTPVRDAAPASKSKTAAKPKEKTAETPTPKPAGEERASMPRLEPPKAPLVAPAATEPPVPKATPVPEPLERRLRELRLSGAGLPVEWRAETEKAAGEGMTEAMIALGRTLLRGGAGDPGKERQAFAWFEKAVQAGDQAAAVSLAGCYLQGWGTPSDFPQAVRLLTRAAAAGDAPAKDLLGVCYARGLGVARDDAKALELVQQAQMAGVPGAFANLGAMYLRGQGTPENPERAAALFGEGAKRGHAESMLLYAQCLENGTGVKANVEEATVWYRRAAGLGNAEAEAWCRARGLQP